MNQLIRSQRSGFAMAFVLLLVLVASLMIGASLTRQNAHTRTVGRQVQEYQIHHDMLGVRSIVELWMGRRTPAELVLLSESDDEAYRFEIEDVMAISVSVEDGQGLPVATMSAVPEGQRGAYKEILDRLPADRSGLLRPRGAPAISVNSAPAPVLLALLENRGEEFADEIINLRERQKIDSETFTRIIRSYPDGEAQAGRLGQIITFEPAVWRLRLTMTDQRGDERTFGMVAEMVQNGVTVHEWLSELDLNLLDRMAQDENDDESPRRSRDTAERNR